MKWHEMGFAEIVPPIKVLHGINGLTVRDLQFDRYWPVYQVRDQRRLDYTLTSVGITINSYVTKADAVFVSTGSDNTEMSDDLIEWIAGHVEKALEQLPLEKPA